MEENITQVPLTYWTEEEKQQHVQQWLTSGQSRQSYSQSQGIKYGTFKNWVNKYHPSVSVKPVDPAPGFIALQLNSPPTMHGQAWAEIHSPNGSRLIIHQPIATNELRHLMS